MGVVVVTPSLMKDATPFNVVLVVSACLFSCLYKLLLFVLPTCVILTYVILSRIWAFTWGGIMSVDIIGLATSLHCTKVLGCCTARSK